MQHILVYSDSLSWGIIPMTRKRLPFEQRWSGALEIALNHADCPVRVIENCLNGRRTVWDDPFKPGRNGMEGLAQQVEIYSPLSLVVLMLGTNDFQSVHSNQAWHAAQGIAALINTIRNAPIEPDMPIPTILVIAPPATHVAKGNMADKFLGADIKCKGFADALLKVCAETNCHFFDAGNIVGSSAIDGVHLDAEQHLSLARALSSVVKPLLAQSTDT